MNDTAFSQGLCMDIYSALQDWDDRQKGLYLTQFAKWTKKVKYPKDTLKRSEEYKSKNSKDGQLCKGEKT